MRVYYIVTNQGDGSYGLRFCESEEVIQFLQEYDPEGFPAESEGSFECEGFSEHLWTLAEAKEHLEEWGHYDNSMTTKQVTNADGSISEYGAQFYR